MWLKKKKEKKEKKKPRNCGTIKKGKTYVMKIPKGKKEAKEEERFWKKEWLRIFQN